MIIFFTILQSRATIDRKLTSTIGSFQIEEIIESISKGETYMASKGESMDYNDMLRNRGRRYRLDIYKKE